MPLSPRVWSPLLACALAAAPPPRCASGVRTCAELPAPSPPYALAIAAAIKSDIPGDANATRAWIEYHRLLGAEHFYLAVNDCHSEATDCLLRSYGRWITRERSLECKEKRSHRHNLQREAYHAMLRAHAPEARAWLFIDADEYVVIPNSSATLGDFAGAWFGGGRRVAAARLAWRDFGDALHAARPAGAILANSVLRLPAARWGDAGASGALDAAARAYAEAHELNLPGLFKVAVNPASRCDMRLHDCVGADPSWVGAVEADEAAPIWLNHYQYKSRAEWDAKVRERENVPSLRGTFPLLTAFVLRGTRSAAAASWPRRAARTGARRRRTTTTTSTSPRSPRSRRGSRGRGSRCASRTCAACGTRCSRTALSRPRCLMI